MVKTFVNFKMQALKVDRTKLKTPKSYAKIIGKTVQQVYNMMEDKKVRVEEIDGVKFIHI